jgi:tetratricopeptide (TPR) repeat protein
MEVLFTALKNLRRYEEAMKCYDEALAIDPNYHEALVMRKLLEEEEAVERLSSLFDDDKKKRRWWRRSPKI